MAALWNCVRLIFVVFSLYLMGDVFFRWNGFSYYASLSEYLPSVALVTILWSIVALLVAMVMWLSVKVIGWFFRRAGFKITSDQLTVFVGLSAFLSAVLWIVRETVFRFTITLPLLCGVLAAFFITWFFRDKVHRWPGVIQERITPLVWLFGIWFVISVSLVSYHTWIKETGGSMAVHSEPGSSLTQKSRPNIILVTFDALTVRDMSVYGYERPTTPFITEWAKEASVFTKLQAEANMTSSTVTSLMTGKRLWTHQVYHIGGSKAVRSDVESLPLMLKNKGYLTVALVANHRASPERFGVSNGFHFIPLSHEFSAPVSLDEWLNIELYRVFGEKIRLHDWIIKEDFIFFKPVSKISLFFSKRIPLSEEDAFNRFLYILDDDFPQPFFAWIHLFPPHWPYSPPAPYMGMFDSSPELTTAESQERGACKGLKEDSYTDDGLPLIDTARARYDEYIRYCDSQFNNFLSRLAEKGMLSNSIIILSSDHGESFEHGYRCHGGEHLYEQVTQIPLVVKEPGQTKGAVIHNLVEQIDVPATILELADIPVPTWMEGRSLVPLLRGESLPERTAFSMALQKNPSLGRPITKGTFAVWEGDYKLIHYLEDNNSLLFNLKEDPDELNDLFVKEHDMGQDLLDVIRKNLMNANQRIKLGN